MKPTRFSLPLLAMALSSLLMACATHVRPLSPALFPAQAAVASLDPATLTLELADADQRYRSPQLRAYLLEVELPIAHIVEAAGLLALREEFARVNDVQGADARALRLRIEDIAPDVNSRMIYFIPLGPIPIDRVDVKTRLAFTVRALGSDGAVRWYQRYDSGQELMVPRKKGMLVAEAVQDGIQRQIHEQAAHLMRQAARELRAWLEQERRRERVL